MTTNTSDNKQIYSLIADIGGTNTRLELVKFTKHDKKPTAVQTQFYKTQESPTFTDCLRDFLKQFENTPQWPQNATLAIAGAPFHNKVKMVNSHWPEIDGDALGEEFNIKPFSLINDFESVGYALLNITEDHLIPLTELKEIQGKSMAIIGSGTGLGEVVVNSGKDVNGEFQYLIFPTEGGHKDFAPKDDLDYEYHKFCLKNVPEVREYHYLSVEKAFCGPAIPNMYKFFSKKEGIEAKELSSKEIFEKAQKKEDPICEKVLAYYASLLGKEASNFACDTLPYAGVYLVGRMINSAIDYFTKDPSCPFLIKFSNTLWVSLGYVAEYKSEFESENCNEINKMYGLWRLWILRETKKRGISHSRIYPSWQENSREAYYGNAVSGLGDIRIRKNEFKIDPVNSHTGAQFIVEIMRKKL